MRLTNINFESSVDYKLTSMVIATISCGGKCWKELGLSSSICQNDKLNSSQVKDISNDLIINKYLDNQLSKSIVFSGLEPFEQFNEILQFISEFRKFSNDDIVLFSGYTEDELYKEIEILKNFKNIIIKFGRYIPNKPIKYDEVLGVNLISNNQFAVKIS